MGEHHLAGGSDVCPPVRCKWTPSLAALSWRIKPVDAANSIVMISRLTLQYLPTEWVFALRRLHSTPNRMRHKINPFFSAACQEKSLTLFRLRLLIFWNNVPPSDRYINQFRSRFVGAY
jgi:hypothetical protein